MYGSPRSYVTDRQRLTWQQTFFKRVISFVYGSLVLLAPEWTVVKRALCRWRRHWSPRHASTRASRRWIAPGGKFQWSLSSGIRRRTWAHRPDSSLGEVHKGILLRAHPHGRGKGRNQSSGGWSGRWERQMKSAKRGSKREQTITQAHDTWMGWRAQTLEPKSCDTSLQVRTNTRKRWRVRCTVYSNDVKKPSSLSEENAKERRSEAQVECCLNPKGSLTVVKCCHGRKR